MKPTNLEVYSIIRLQMTSI